MPLRLVSDSSDPHVGGEREITEEIREPRIARIKHVSTNLDACARGWRRSSAGAMMEAREEGLGDDCRGARHYDRGSARR